MTTGISSSRPLYRNAITVAVAISAIVAVFDIAFCEGFQQQQRRQPTRLSFSSLYARKTKNNNSRRRNDGGGSNSKRRSRSRRRDVRVETLSSPSLSSALHYNALGDGEFEEYTDPMILSGSGSGSSSRERNTNRAGSAAADFDVEDILGDVRKHEYDRDADFYRQRNEEYQRQIKEEEQKMNNLLTNSNNNNGKESNNINNGNFIMDNAAAVESINTSLKASQSSFKHVEKNTFEIMTNQPLIALAIFVAAGLFVAYMVGFFCLDGYIDNINPLKNGRIPHWDEPEIHTIERALIPITSPENIK